MNETCYDEVPSFNDITALYDDSFFADHTLILAYVTAPSGSFRYAIQDISHGGSTFCLDVVQTNDPETHTDDMAGWFVIAEVLDSDIADDILFDARLVVREYSESCSGSGQSLSRVQLFVTPWTAACQASLSITNSRSLLKLMSISSSVIPFSTQSLATFKNF